MGYAHVPTPPFAPKPKNPPTPKKDNPAKDAICHQCGEVGHWRKNCPVYLVELLKKKKLSQGASTLDMLILRSNALASVHLGFTIRVVEPKQPKGRPKKKDYKKVMLAIMDDVGFNQKDIDITLGHNFLKLNGATITIFGGRKIDEEVYISKEHSCNPIKVIAELAKGELLLFFTKDTAFTSFFKEKVKNGVFQCGLRKGPEKPKKKPNKAAKGNQRKGKENIGYAHVPAPHFAPKPKNPPTPKKDNPAKDTICHQCGEVGHWIKNCPVYLAKLLKKKSYLKELAL
uniref:Zinc finger, CCHC-type n=1 Tax=Tanacetum cinerariifolium TaxID=118510 RepID=A0A699GNG3_TANCI|nr:zinc finger, CCHC-type [Tanacetum cinerariifolium]